MAMDLTALVGTPRQELAAERSIGRTESVKSGRVLAA
jgi:hypothetical protein